MPRLPRTLSAVTASVLASATAVALTACSPSGDTRSGDHTAVNAAGVPHDTADPLAAPVRDALGAHVLDKDGEVVPASHFDDKELILFYGSAEWCGPCRRFTPILIDFYEKRGGGERFEVVLVSSDHSAADASNYMRHYPMPWTMVPFEPSRLDAAKRFRSGNGIPDLVAVRRDGTVLAASYVDGEYRGPSAVLEAVERALMGGG